MNATLVFPEKLPVIAELNGVREIVAWVDDHEARRLLKNRKVELCHTSKKVRALKLIDSTPGERISFAASELKHTRYSHNHETENNPENCWTLIHLPRHTHQVFMAVVAGVGGVRAIRRKRKQQSLPHAA